MPRRLAGSSCDALALWQIDQQRAEHELRQTRLGEHLFAKRHARIVLGFDRLLPNSGHLPEGVAIRPNHGRLTLLIAHHIRSFALRGGTLLIC
ncbi:conserved hypothetical protein [Stutzerimonas stutzeri A1501]|uniref:Uncharacterized protein n=1 Tax=Stutzerimonas stutzeri (strain A1501) TaxID=379731 RepID=A4VNS1_STUS1|nr:conserved hypothetical protein [Stutzerimonas stutzeri A1501]